MAKPIIAVGYEIHLSPELIEYVQQNLDVAISPSSPIRSGVYYGETSSTRPCVSSHTMEKWYATRKDLVIPSPGSIKNLYHKKFASVIVAEITIGRDTFFSFLHNPNNLPTGREKDLLLMSIKAERGPATALEIHLLAASSPLEESDRYVRVPLDYNKSREVNGKAYMFR